MNHIDRFKAALKRDQAIAAAFAYGQGFGTGARRGYSGGCQCHRNMGCSPYTRQGLYTLKMARAAAAKRYFHRPHTFGSYETDQQATELREAFIRGFKCGARAKKGRT